MGFRKLQGLLYFVCPLFRVATNYKTFFKKWSSFLSNCNMFRESVLLEFHVPLFFFFLLLPLFSGLSFAILMKLDFLFYGV